MYCKKNKYLLQNATTGPGFLQGKCLVVSDYIRNSFLEYCQENGFRLAVAYQSYLWCYNNDGPSELMLIVIL